jgi:hypothetical protein
MSAACKIDDSLRCVVCGSRVTSRHVLRNCVNAVGHSDLAPRLPPAPSGPGTELSKLLKRFGIEPTPTCQCRAKAAEMDAWGPDECSRPERIEEVVAVMREEAQARGLPFLDAAGKVLVRRAISNARKAEARQQAGA